MKTKKEKDFYAHGGDVLVTDKQPSDFKKLTKMKTKKTELFIEIWRQMKTTKGWEEELKKLQSPNLSMPKIYSFDEAKKLVKLAHQKGREEVIEKVEKIIDQIGDLLSELREEND